MGRVPVTELSLVVRGEQPGPCWLSWTLRQRADYPSRPGRATRWQVLGTRQTMLDGLKPRSVKQLAERLLDPRVVPLFARLEDERRNGSWVRAAIELAAPSVDRWPWEAVFAGRRLVVVRRSHAPYGERSREPLQFPLRLAMVFREGGQIDSGDGADPLANSSPPRGILELAARRGGTAWARLVREAVDRGALKLVPLGRPADIVHVEDPEPGSPLPRFEWRPRLLILQGRALESQSGMCPWEYGAEAVLKLPARASRTRLYSELLRDRPLDMIAARLVRLRRSILSCGDDGETCVSLSGILDAALRADGRDPDTTPGLDVIGTAGAHGLTSEWNRALARPIDDVITRAGALGIRDARGELSGAVALAAEARAVSVEQPAVRRVLQDLAARGDAHVAAVSTRVTQVELRDAERGAPLPPIAALAVGTLYQLRVQVVRAAAAMSWLAELVPEGALRATFERVGSADLSVVLYAEPDVVSLSATRGVLRVPAVGDSAPVGFALRVQRPGRFAVRVCLYHGTVLLQAVLVRGRAGERARPSEVEFDDDDASHRMPAHEDAPPFEAELDFAATSHLMQLAEHAQPDVAIWTNSTIEGSHWFGVFTGGRSEVCGLTDGSLVALSSGLLANVSDGLQDALQQAQLLPSRRYRYDPPAPNDDTGDRAAQLEALAQAGWRAYTALFNRAAPVAVSRSGLLAIARCRPERQSIAWAALYDYYLDSARPRLCSVFQAESRSAEDLLADPERCHARPGCPLSDPERARHTVCPFGFWGIRHRIEQPLLHVAVRGATTAGVAAREPGAADVGPTLECAATTTPLAMAYDRLQAAARLRPALALPPDRAPRIVIAEWPHFDARAKAHLADVAQLTATPDRTQRSARRGEVLQAIAAGETHIYYFFCHGEGTRLTFCLVVGEDDDAPGHIAVSDLNHPRYAWPPSGPAPLVFLNGCDTVAFKSDTINHLLEQLRAMGASGVIGSEIPVHTYLAEDVGRRVLAAFVGGAQLGDAFLAMRRSLLREQWNPLGLAYSLFAAAQLHLCAGHGCRVCTGHASSNQPRRES